MAKPEARDIPGDEGARILSVSELGVVLRRALEETTKDVLVVGEIANLREVESGHVYFTLRDERATAAIDCVMYRSAPVRARRLVTEGQRLVLGGRVTFWAPRGRVQFVVESARPAGKGALLEALAKLRAALSAEGLFAAERKRPLSRDPKIIGLVTSGQGAALHDVLTVAFARAPVRFVVVTAPVQGPGAAEAMSRALRRLYRHPGLDAVLLARGGGSADDLGAFNEEVLVRTIAACPVPLVSAVGHEIDITLADLAADVRAATPSQAAELLVPDARARRELLSHLKKRLGRATRRIFDERQQRIDVLSSELEANARRSIAIGRDRTSRLDRRLAARHPSAVLSSARARVTRLEQRLAAVIQRELGRRRGELAPAARLADLAQAWLVRARLDLANATARLDALSPLSVLARGYAIVRRERDGSVVMAPGDVDPGSSLAITVAQGTLRAVVLPAPGDAPERDPSE